VAENIIVKVGADTKKADQAIRKFSANVKKQAADMRDSLFKIENVFAATAAFLAIKQIGAALSGTVDDAIEAENAVTNLNVALKLAGEFSLETSKEIQEMAGAIEQTTTTSAESVIEMTALAQSFVKTSDDAKELTNAALDFAQGAGISFEEAVRRLGRGVQGATGDIGNFVPEVRLLTREQLAAGDATRMLADRFRGAAAAAADTYSGKVVQLDNAFGKISESIGNLIVKNPFLIEAMEAAKDAFVELAKFIDNNRDSIITLTNNGFAIMLAITIPLVKGVEFLRRSFNSLQEAVLKVRLAFQQLRNLLPDLAGNAMNTLNTTMGRTIPLVGMLNSLFSDTDSDSLSAKDAIASLNKELEDNAASSEKTNEAMTSVIEKLTELGAAALEARTAINGEGEDEQSEKDEEELEGLTLKQEQRLEIILAGLTAEQQAVFLAETQILKDKKKFAEIEKKLQVAEDKAALKKAKDVERAKLGIFTKAQKDKLDATQESLGLLANVASAFGKRGFLVQKRLMQGQALISAFLAANNALATTLAPAPGPQIVAAATLASGLATVAKIEQQQAPAFQDGGIVPGASFRGDQVNARVNSGELILNNEQQARLFDLATGGAQAGGATQSFVFNIAGQVGDSEETKEAIAEAVRDAQEFQNFNTEVA
jgi:hypothetical protein